MPHLRKDPLRLLKLVLPIRSHYWQVATDFKMGAPLFVGHLQSGRQVEALLPGLVRLGRLTVEPGIPPTHQLGAGLGKRVDPGKANELLYTSQSPLPAPSGKVCSARRPANRSCQFH